MKEKSYSIDIPKEAMIDWVQDNCNPREVFSVGVISEWLQDDHYNPEDVFSEDQLEEWAEKKGFVKSND